MAKERERSKPVSSDEVDASKGIFPFGTPHPDDATPVQPGELGGGPYEESGRSGLGTGSAGAEPITEGASVPVERPSSASAGERKSTEPGEPKGALPEHRESR
ncbi:MAG: hypothetical protein HYV09_11015 [Deltaproteobacteria bacterium]|nr:hypothetical protein [Deltaproteobacteria bacterium]